MPVYTQRQLCNLKLKHTHVDRILNIPTLNKKFCYWSHNVLPTKFSNPQNLLNFESKIQIKISKKIQNPKNTNTENEHNWQKPRKLTQNMGCNNIMRSAEQKPPLPIQQNSHTTTYKPNPLRTHHSPLLCVKTIHNIRR